MPLVGGFARATRSADLIDDRAAIVDTQDEIQQRHLALLMSGDPHDYDPVFLADGAERILVTGKDLNRAQYPADYPGGQDLDDYPGFANSEWLYDDPGLGIPQVVAMRALDGSTEAAWSFVTRGQEHVDDARAPAEPADPHDHPDLRRVRGAVQRDGRPRRRGHRGGVPARPVRDGARPGRPHPAHPARHRGPVDLGVQRLHGVGGAGRRQRHHQAVGGPHAAPPPQLHRRRRQHPGRHARHRDRRAVRAGRRGRVLQGAGLRRGGRGHRREPDRHVERRRDPPALRRQPPTPRPARSRAPTTRWPT